jgi:citrate lyase beta subunit
VQRTRLAQRFQDRHQIRRSGADAVLVPKVESAAEVASKKIALLRARAQLSRKHRDRLSAFAAGLGFATAQAMALSSLDRGKVM